MNGIALANTNAYQRHIYQVKIGLGMGVNARAWSVERWSMEHPSIHPSIMSCRETEVYVCSLVGDVAQYRMFRCYIDKNKVKRRGSMVRAEMCRDESRALYAMYAIYAKSVRNVGK